ncbi:MAG TPA: fasciclin domain-containing protein [Candidatus Gastranaerophilales bacterium]|nr:fasciclin domain-containing protein [Candidatus Gastranaerophilales bacterium]
MKKILFALFMTAIFLNINQTALAQNVDIIPGSLNNNNNLSVAETLSSSNDFHCFSQLLQCSGLAKTLKGRGPYTVFAPSDAAFAKLPQGTVQRLMCPQNKGQLNRFIRYHIVKDPLSCKDIASSPSIRTSDGRCITVFKGCNQLCLDHARVEQTNICAKNGLIHVVQDVLLPGGFMNLT